MENKNINGCRGSWVVIVRAFYFDDPSLTLLHIIELIILKKKPGWAILKILSG